MAARKSEGFPPAPPDAEVPVASPLTRILMRHRDGLRAYLGPPSVTPEAGLPTPAVNIEESNQLNAAACGKSKARLAPAYSPSGDKVAVIRDEGQALAVFCAVTGAELGQIGCLDAQSVTWSPMGTYLVTWSRPTKGKEDGSVDGNLKVWDLSKGNSAETACASYSQKTFKRDMLQWTNDEQLCCRMVTNEVHIHPGNLQGAFLGKIRHEGATQFRVAPSGIAKGSCTVGIFQAESNGNPARTTLYYFTLGQTAATVGTSRTMFAASEATMHWNASGNSLLVHTHSDVDKSNTSYYGATGIFLLTTSAYGDLSEKISQTKEGPIHDVKWSPVGDKFILAAGTMPAQCTMYDSKGKTLFEFGAAHRNTVCWSPHGRFVCIAGFGNLAGEMDFYDMDPKKMKKIGSNTAHCSVSFGWSPDSRYFLTATLAPRMNVDNGFKVFKYNGAGPVVHVPAEQAFDVLWQPLPVSSFPSRGQSPRRLAEGADASGAASAALPVAPAPRAVYRPPGSTGVLAAMLSRDKAPVGKVKADGSVNVAATVPSGARYPGDGVQRQRVIPGMAPSQAAAAAAEADKAAKKKAEKEKQKQREEEKKRAAEAEAVAAAAAAAAAAQKGPVPIEQLSAAEKEKRVRALRKKLNLIGELKAKGGVLNDDQKAKIATEESVIAELALLGV